MANFGDAFKKLSIKEGGYVNDKDQQKSIMAHHMH